MGIAGVHDDEDEGSYSHPVPKQAGAGGGALGIGSGAARTTVAASEAKRTPKNFIVCTWVMGWRH